jgi:hypothetical protein
LIYLCSGRTIPLARQLPLFEITSRPNSKQVSWFAVLFLQRHHPAAAENVNNFAKLAVWIAALPHAAADQFYRVCVIDLTSFGTKGTVVVFGLTKL